LPSWPGLGKASHSVAHFVSLQDLEHCERLAAKARNAVVVGGGLIGVELVECLAFHGMHVVFLVREPWYWPVALSGEEAGMISAHIRRHGVDVRVDEEVSEVLTDDAGSVRGVRTLAGSEFRCEMLGITIGVHPAVEWLQQVTTPPGVGRGIQVTPDFRTSLEHVWAAGDCAEIQLDGRPPLVEQLWYSAKRQGELAARSMLGDAIRYDPPIFYNSSKFFEIEFTTVGTVVDAPAESVHLHRRLAGKEISVHVVAFQGAVIGFNPEEDRKRHTVTDLGVVVVTEDDDPLVEPISEEALRIEAEDDGR
jgi:NADPH-dependent 2,4-dienoyl-CoA reductase/sulfur reductase-like enzyme